MHLIAHEFWLNPTRDSARVLLDFAAAGGDVEREIITEALRHSGDIPGEYPYQLKLDQHEWVTAELPQQNEWHSPLTKPHTKTTRTTP